MSITTKTEHPQHTPTQPLVKERKNSTNPVFSKTALEILTQSSSSQNTPSSSLSSKVIVSSPEIDKEANQPIELIWPRLTLTTADEKALDIEKMVKIFHQSKDISSRKDLEQIIKNQCTAWMRFAWPEQQKLFLEKIGKFAPGLVEYLKKSTQF